jgi:hypothetical protein
MSLPTPEGADIAAERQATMNGWAIIRGRRI